MKMLLAVPETEKTSSFDFQRDEETAELHREATRFKDLGDWDKAVATLQKAQTRMRESSFTQHTTESWLRLPLFLQQSGHFEEAMAEFKRVLDETDARISGGFSHQPKSVQHGFTHHARATIYDKMRLACKRQKLPKEADKYEELRDNFMAKHDKFISKRRLG